MTHASTRTHIAADAAAIIVVTFPHCGTHLIHTPASPAGIKRHFILLTVKGTFALHVSIIITNPFCPLLFCPRLTPSRPLFPRFVVIKLRRRSGALSPCLSWASAPASPLVSLDWSSVTLLPPVLSDFGGHSSLAGACERLVPMHQWCCKASAAKGRDGQRGGSEFTPGSAVGVVVQRRSTERDLSKADHTSEPMYFPVLIGSAEHHHPVSTFSTAHLPYLRRPDRRPKSIQSSGFSSLCTSPFSPWSAQCHSAIGHLGLSTQPAQGWSKRQF